MPCEMGWLRAAPTIGTQGPDIGRGAGIVVAGRPLGLVGMEAPWPAGVGEGEVEGCDGAR
jgi:hypothetical protein